MTDRTVKTDITLEDAMLELRLLVLALVLAVAPYAFPISYRPLGMLCRFAAILLVIAVVLLATSAAIPELGKAMVEPLANSEFFRFFR